MTKWNMPIVSRLNQNFNVNMQILTWILDVYYMILFSQLTLIVMIMFSLIIKVDGLKILVV